MGDVFDGAMGLFGRRRLLTAWLPVLVFVAGILLIAASGTGWRTYANWWARLPTVGEVIIAIVVIGGFIIAAEVLAGNRASLMRIYQGQWRNQRLIIWGQNRASRKADPTQPWAFPTPDRVRPTRLGNVIEAAVQQADRYGMDGPTAWPRLYPVLPDAFTTLLGQATSSLELMVTVSLLGGVFAIGGTAIAITLSTWYWATTAFAVGCVAAWVGYLGAVGAALRYGQLIRTAFDVHRWLLLDAMGLRRPASWADELEQWRQLHLLWQRGRPDSGGAARLGYHSSEPPS